MLLLCLLQEMIIEFIFDEDDAINIMENSDLNEKAGLLWFFLIKDE